MAAERVAPEETVVVAELHKRLLPYHACRDDLGYATKAEYDVALLRLLADEDRIAMSEPALREAVRAEVRQPEPGLAFLHRFAASEIRLKDPGPHEPLGEPPAPPAAGGAGRGVVDSPAPGGPAAAEAGVCRRCAAPMPGVEGARFCPACGADQVLPTCPECGSEVDEGWRYCAFCGKLQADEAG